MLTALLVTGADPWYAAFALGVILTLSRQRQALPWSDIVQAGRPLLDAATAGLKTRENAATASAPTLQRASDLNMWPGVVVSFLEALAHGIRHRLIPVESSTDVAGVLDSVTDFWCANQSKASSDVDYQEKRWRSVGELLAPLVVDVLASASYWLAALQAGREQSEGTPAPELAVGARLDRLLDPSVACQSAVLAAFGNVLPFLVISEREWVDRNRSLLFANETLDLVLYGSVRRFHYYRETFDFLRPELIRLITALSRGAQRSGLSEERRIKLIESFAERVRDAWLDGRATASDNDGLARRVFELCSKHGQQHAYWGIYRGWTDSEGPVPIVVVQRCIDLWRWRLSVLEGQQPSESRAREAAELLWLLTTPQLPIPEVIPLAIRTVKLGPKRRPPLSRLAELTAADPVGTYDLFAEMARHTLKTRSAYLQPDEVAHAFRFVLVGEDVRRRDEAEQLLDQLARLVNVSFADIAP